MKLFIGQPMRGKTNEEILNERERITKECQEHYDTDVEVLDTFFKDAPHENHPLWYLGESIKLLGQADTVYFADDWQNYRGCKIEHEIAVQYDIKIIRD